MKILVNSRIQNAQYQLASQKVMEDLKFFKEKGDTSGEAQMYLRICDMLIAQNAPQDVMSTASEAHELFKGLGDSAGEANCMIVLANAKMKMNKTREANKLVSTALPLLEEKGTPEDLATAYLTLARVQCAKQAIELSLDACDKAFGVYMKANDTFGKGIATLEMARVNMAKKPPASTKAIKIAQEALDLFHSQKAYKNAEDVLLFLIPALLDTDEDVKAVAMASKHLEQVERCDDKSIEVCAYFKIVNIFFNADNYKAALSIGEESLQRFAQLGVSGAVEAICFAIQLRYA